jgi:hypothetical protein
VCGVCGDVWGVWGTFDIPQTALVATLDTYDFLFYFILFYFILFYFILFYFILFYFILFYFILFYIIFRSVADNLNLLKDEIYHVRDQNRNLQRKLEEEISARKKLESIMRCNVLPNRQDIEWNE